MGLFGGDGGGGDASTIIGIAVLCTVISLVMTIGVGALLPSTGDYNFDEITNERMEIANFTGESIVNQTPWALQGVYTPWQYGDPYNVTDEDYLYGESIDDYPYLYGIFHKTVGIKLDPAKKSSIPLSYGQQMGRATVAEEQWWASIGPLNWIGTALGFDPIVYKEVDKMYSVWNYTGYRYEFDPMLPFDNETSAVDGKLSIVWYSNNQGDGISGGLLIYGRDDVLLAQIEAADIIANYNTMSGYSTKYRFDFEGSDIYLNIRFDAEVINQSENINEAWAQGHWSLGITSPSAGNFMDVRQSTSFTSTLGNIWDTFKSIFTFNLPDLGGYWNIVLWLLCSFPAELALLLFCSRLGVAGIPAAILGNILVVS